MISSFRNLPRSRALALHFLAVCRDIKVLFRPRSHPLSLPVESNCTQTASPLHLQIRERMTKDGFLKGKPERQESCLVPKIQAVWPGPIFHSK